MNKNVIKALLMSAITVAFAFAFVGCNKTEEGAAATDTAATTASPKMSESPAATSTETPAATTTPSATPSGDGKMGGTTK